MDIKALQAARGGRNSERQATENIPVRVDAYDTSNPDRPVVIGTRMDNNETISVFLRPDPKAAERKKPRPEVADFAADARKSKVSTDIGGVIRFDRAFELQNEPGVFSAAWAQALAHTADEAKVLVGMARALPPKEIAGQTRQAVEMMFPDSAERATNEQSLKSAVIRALASDTPGATGAYLVVEATNQETGEVQPISFRVSSSVTRSEDGKSIDKDSPEVAYGKWAETPVGKVVLGELRAAGEANIQVIPMTRINVGLDTITNTAGTSQSLENKFKYKDGNGFGFAEASVAIRSRENGSVYVTEVLPLKNDRMFYSPENVPTPERPGVPAPVEEAGVDGPGDDDEMLFDAAEVNPGPEAPGQDALAQLDNAGRRSRGMRP